MIVLGITGASGSGKSSLVGFLRLPVVDADIISREVVQKDSECLNQLCKQFGKEILLADGTLDRKCLAQIAFSDPQSTLLLNSITHPFIVKKMKYEINRFKESGEKAIILDAPQLFEAGCEALCDITVGVIAEKSIRLKRILTRDGISEKEAISRLNREKSDSFFREKCDIIIENNDDISALKKSAYGISRIIFKENNH